MKNKWSINFSLKNKKNPENHNININVAKKCFGKINEPL